MDEKHCFLRATSRSIPNLRTRRGRRFTLTLAKNSHTHTPSVLVLLPTAVIHSPNCPVSLPAFVATPVRCLRQEAVPSKAESQNGIYPPSGQVGSCHRFCPATSRKFDRSSQKSPANFLFSLFVCLPRSLRFLSPPRPHGLTLLPSWVEAQDFIYLYLH